MIFPTFAKKAAMSMKNQPQQRPLLSFDWAVKRLLRNKANYVVLEGFLSELLKRQIKVKHILESESNMDAPLDKSNRVDILVENENRELIIIELQFTNEFDYFHRMLYGTSKVITQFIDRGNEYGTVRKVYSINIVYFNLGEGKDYVYHGHTSFHGLHTGDELQLTSAQRKEFGALEAGDLFPEYYILEVKRFDDVAKDTLDEWIYYLKHDAVIDGFKAQGLAQARELLDYDRLSDEDKRAYDRAVDNRRSQRSSIYTAKKEGRAEGLMEGEAIGREKGKAEGEEEATRKFVLALWRKQLSVKDISELTNLPEQKIQDIVKKEV
jgi:predicted transposase/invertase (TIGR01784 family)